MSGADSWRSERSAQLAGTPFARPTAIDPLAVTVPMMAASKAAPMPARPGGRQNRLTWWIVGIVAAGTVIVALLARAGHRPPTSQPVVVTAPAKVATPPLAMVAPPVVAAPPAIAAPRADPVATPSVVAAPPHTPPTTRAIVAPRIHQSSARTVRHRNTVTTRHAGPSSRAVGGKSRTAPAKVEERIGAILTAPVTATRRPLPVCQPQVYARAPRPCRPSHTRIVRKPFFSK